MSDDISRALARCKWNGHGSMVGECPYSVYHSVVRILPANCCSFRLLFRKGFSGAYQKQDRHVMANARVHTVSLISKIIVCLEPSCKANSWTRHRRAQQPYQSHDQSGQPVITNTRRISAKEGAYTDYDVEKSGSTWDLQSSMIEGFNCCSRACLYECGISVTM